MLSCYYDGETNSIADLFYIKDADVWCITRINVPKQFRGKGTGTRLLKQILDAADKEGAVLVLTVSSSDGLSNDQLDAWYQRHGFVMDPTPKQWAGKDIQLHKWIMRRYPRPIPTVDVVFLADEIAYFRTHHQRCGECNHLLLLHESLHSLELDVICCKICPCGSMRVG